MNSIILPYLEIEPKIQTGDLIELRTNSVVGWIIRLWTHSVNHSTLTVRPLSEQDNRVHVVEAVWASVKLNLLWQRVIECNGKIYWSPLKEEFDDRRCLIEEFLLSLRGKPYDFQSLLFNIFGRVSVETMALFCSELVTVALVDAEIIEKQEWSPRPGEFDKFNCFGETVRIK